GSVLLGNFDGGASPDRSSADGNNAIESVTAASTAVAAETNIALASAGAVASASSTLGTGFEPSSVLDRRRAGATSGPRGGSGATWGGGGGWADGTPGSFPDWIEIDFPTSAAISHVNVFSVQDVYFAPGEPTAAQTFTWYGLRNFEVQYWTGSAWAAVPGTS